MQTRLLGKTGLQVPILSFGASSLGQEFRPVTLDEAIRSVRVALECGLKLLDTAPFYGRGMSEVLLGIALRDVPRDSYWLCTKLGRYDLHHFDFSARRVVESIDVSLHRLGTDHLDIDIPEPPAPGPGEALVRVHAVGICGTDISGYLGRMPFFSYPRIPGHELGVEVLAVGEGVTNIQRGDRCAVEPYINCQTCSACRRDHANCCENHQTLGVHCDGGLRPRFLVPARKLHPSGRLGFDQLALVETLAIGCHAVNRGDPKPGEIALVIGAGPIGLAVIEFVKLTGARCLVLDLVPSRLEFCRKMGVDGVILATGDGAEVEEIRRQSGGELPHVVVDATGNDQSMSRALEYCAFAGRLVYVGITRQEIRFPHAPVMHRRELTLLASRNALAADFKRIIQLIEDCQLDTRPWITHRARFDDLIEQFPSYTRPETGVIKAIVDLD